MYKKINEKTDITDIYLGLFGLILYNKCIFKI